MNNSEYIKILSFKDIGEDNRGVTKEFLLSRKQQDFIYITRKQGTISGNSYHQGKNSATNPKSMLLISGEIEFSYRPVTSSIKECITLTGPLLIEIKPNVVHAVKALTDIILIECNSIKDIQNDVTKEIV